MSAKPGAASSEDDPVRQSSPPSAPSACPHCGALIDPTRSGGVCAACALGDALMVGEGLGEIGGHVLVEEIARGGMGVVYRARQQEPEREVALKTLLGAELSSASARERFRIEARVMADLEHPGILPIHTFGEQDGVPYFTMQLASGGSLATRRETLAGSWRTIAELVAEIADAVQFAHERGVLHRDLKPGNILFDESGRAFVSDFGLAKVAATEAQLTRSVALMGTPNYLAPEIAVKDARAATTASDVWSLGAILYELLAQRPPFAADSVPALLRRIVEDEPDSLVRRTDPGTPAGAPRPASPPRDLGVIAGKALAKRPEQRYTSARALADDLRRWLAGRPIHARPATALERFGSWSRRNPALAGSLALLALTLVAFTVSQYANTRRLTAALAETQLREVRLRRGSERVGQRFASLATIAGLVRDLPRSSHAALRTEAAAALALPDLRPRERWPVPSVSVTGTEAFSEDLSQYAAVQPNGRLGLFRTADRQLLHTWSHPQANAIQDLSFVRGGRWFTARFDDRHWEILPLDPAAQKVVARTTIALHPDGNQYATVRSGEGLRLVSIPDGSERPIPTPPLHEDPLLLDPSGDRFLAVTGEGMGIIGSLADGRTVAKLGKLPLRITASDWSLDGKWLAIAEGAPPYAIAIFDTANGVETARFVEHQMPVRQLEFHPDSASFAAASDGQKLIWRSIEAGGFRVELEAGERALAFSRDGQRLGYSPGDGELGTLDVAQSAVFHAWPEPVPDGTNAAYTAALSPDGRWVATATDRGIRVWDARARREVAAQLHRARRPWWSTVCFAPEKEAQLIWSALGDGVWRADLDEAGHLVNPEAMAPGQDGIVQEFAPDNRSLVVIDREDGQNIARLWPNGDPSSARTLAQGAPFAGFRLLRGQSLGFSTHFSAPDLWLWNAETGQRVRSLGISEPAASEPSPDGRWLLTGTRTENVLWDTRTWLPASRWPARPGERDAWAPAFSADSRFLAKAMPTGEVSLRRVPSGEEVLTLIPPRPLRLQQLIFTPDGQRLVMLQATGRLHEWDLRLLNEDLRALGLEW